MEQIKYSEYNCAGSAFETQEWECFASWTIKNYNDGLAEYTKAHWDGSNPDASYSDVRKAFEEEFDLALAREAATRFMKKLSVYAGEKNLPVGTVLLRCQHNPFSSDFHFIRKAEILGEECWISKAGEHPEEIWFDDQVFVNEWDGGYDRKIYVLS